MLRLTRVPAQPHLIRLKVEGTITQASVFVLEHEIESALAGARRVELDFRDVVYLDGSGVELLRNLPCERVQIVDCAPLIRELLNKELT